jgi:8-oxo-dGTP diphosphatase
VSTAPGRRHWGRFGAAGLVLLQAPAADPAAPTARLLMQLRAGWTHEGGAWGVVGGARDSHESVAETALREAAEEAGVDPARVRVLATQTGVDHGIWSYTYVIALADPGMPVENRTPESDALRWIDLDDVPRLPLHAGLAATWARLRPAIDAALAAR